MFPDQKLQELGLQLPDAPKPVAAYVPSVRTGNLLFVSGQLPFAAGKLLATGRVPTNTTVDQAKAAAQQCVLNALAIVSQELGGSLSRVKRVVRLGVFVQSAEGFYDQPQVANGASELLQIIFGEAGRHVRTTLGVFALPLNAAVEVECLFEIE